MEYFLHIFIGFCWISEFIPKKGEISEFQQKFSAIKTALQQNLPIDKLTKIFVNISVENFDLELILIRNYMTENSKILHFFEIKSEIYHFGPELGYGLGQYLGLKSA